MGVNVDERPEQVGRARRGTLQPRFPAAEERSHAQNEHDHDKRGGQHLNRHHFSVTRALYSPFTVQTMRPPGHVNVGTARVCVGGGVIIISCGKQQRRSPLLSLCRERQKRDHTGISTEY